LQADYLWFGQDDASLATVGDVPDVVDFRRARFTARGEAFDVVEYAIGFDFALAGRPSFFDVFVGVHDLPYLDTVRVGHYFEPFSLERVTQNRYNTFMERSPADAFAPARNNTGITTYQMIGDDDRGTWALG
jgi:phosphate-selective porin OprO/OprP